jgi:hypothetical protein
VRRRGGEDGAPAADRVRRAAVWAKPVVTYTLIVVNVALFFLETVSPTLQE